MFIGWSSTRFVFGADLKFNMAARVHNVLSLAEIIKIFLSEATKPKRFQRRFLEIDQSETRITCGGHVY
jgi:hypothetical protein